VLEDVDVLVAECVTAGRSAASIAEEYDVSDS
jgi:hypothetical protein